jgi:SpoU rRNA methylase family enzyme
MPTFALLTLDAPNPGKGVVAAEDVEGRGMEVIVGATPDAKEASASKKFILLDSKKVCELGLLLLLFWLLN